jgi:microsomal epoxide hydrolase
MLVIWAILAILFLTVGLAEAAQDRSFVTSDGVRLHYLEAGRGRTIVLVPGWTMPGWIFERQIAAFSAHYRVIAFDPRGQGESEVSASGYEPTRRGRDIGELIGRLGPDPVLLVGWSLGVLDALAYVHADGDTALAGLVLVDNSVGEEPAPAAPKPGKPGPKLSHEAYMRGFVRSMFLHPPPAAWPKFAGQAGNLAAHHPAAECVVLHDVGHALFVDDAVQFDAILQDFIRRRIWR